MTSLNDQSSVFLDKNKCIYYNCDNYTIDNYVDYCHSCLRIKILSIIKKSTSIQVTTPELTKKPILTRGFMNSFNALNRLLHDGLAYGVITIDEIK